MAHRIRYNIHCLLDLCESMHRDNTRSDHPLRSVVIDCKIKHSNQELVIIKAIHYYWISIFANRISFFSGFWQIIEWMNFMVVKLRWPISSHNSNAETLWFWHMPSLATCAISNQHLFFTQLFRILHIEWNEDIFTEKNQCGTFFPSVVCGRPLTPLSVWSLRCSFNYDLRVCSVHTIDQRHGCATLFLANHLLSHREKAEKRGKNKEHWFKFFGQ